MFSDIRNFFLASVGSGNWEIKTDNNIKPILKSIDTDKVKPGVALYWVANTWEEHHPGEQYFCNTPPNIK